MSSKEDNSLVSKDILKSMGYVLPDEISEVYPSAHNIKDMDHSSHTLTHTYTATRKHAHTIHTNTNTQPLLIYSTHSIVHALFFPKINADRKSVV